MARHRARPLAAIRFACLVLAASALFAADAPAAQSAGRPLVTGFSGVYDYDEPAAVEHVKAAGATLIRIQVDWIAIAPRQLPASWDPADPLDPNYNWNPVDLAVTRAAAAGLTPVLSLDTAPAWAQGCALEPVTAPCNPDQAAFAQFSTAAARRYSGQVADLPRVRYWQGLNEPNLFLFFNPQYENGQAVSPTIYRRLLNTFTTAVKAVDPSNLVLAAGLAPLTAPAPIGVGPMQFTRELLCMTGRRKPHRTAGDCEGGVHFDIFDIHPYTSGSPTHAGGPDDVELGDLDKLQALLRAADRAGRIKGKFGRSSLWVTELSWDTNPPDPRGLAMPIATRWTAEALYRAWKAGVTHLFWFRIRDGVYEPNYPEGPIYQSGLYFRGASAAEDRPKKNFYAFRFPFVAYPGKRLAFWGRTPTSSPGKVRIQLKRGGWSTAATVRADANGIFKGSIPSRYGKNFRGAARAKFGKGTSPAFSMKPVKDFFQPPFGS